MKKITIQIFAFLAFAFTWQANAQISINENLNSGFPTGWSQFSYFTNTTSTYLCEGTGNVGDNMFGSASNDGTITSSNYVGISNATDATVSFQWLARPYLSNAVDFIISVEYSTNDGTSWDLISSFPVTETTPCTTYSEIIPAASLPSGADFKFRVRGQWQSGDSYFYLDDIKINQIATSPPNCDAALTTPANGASDAPLSGNIAWSAATGVPSGYDVSVGSASGLSDVYSASLGNVNSTNIGTLAQGTTYFVNILPTNANGPATGCTEYSFTTKSFVPGEICETAIVVGALPYTTTDNTSNYLDSYNGSPGASGCGSTSTYLNGDDVVYAYTATSDTSINVSMTPTATYSGIFVYTDCADIGVNCVAGVANSGASERVFDLTVTNGTTYYFVISTWATPQSTAYTLNITENTCTAATANYAVVNDCAISGGFYIDVNVTDMGSATNLTISDDQGSADQYLTADGTVQFGPYVNAINVTITVNDDNDDDSCTVVSSVLTQTACPPTNDDCSNATALTVDPDYSCASSVSGTTIAATQSLAGCMGTADDDVWYSFVATGTDHRITITNTGGTADIVTEVFDSCGGTSLKCQDTPNSPIELTGLTAGNTYFFRIYTYFSGSTTRSSFNVCVGTPPSCLAPTGLVATAIDETSANLVWTEAGTATTWNVEWGAGTFAQGTGTMITGTSNNPEPITGLTPFTAYQFYVQADCGSGDLSAWSGPYGFITDGPVATNISCATATVLTCGDVVNGSTVGSTGTSEDIGCTMGNNGVWYTFVGDGEDLIITTSASFDHRLAIGSGSCGALVNIVCRDGSTGAETYNLVGSTMGETYYIYIARYNSGSTVTGTYDIKLEGCSTMTTDEFSAPDAFTYYPNPVTNVLNVKAKNNISNVAVYNMLGQEVLRTAPNTVASEVNMSNLQSGAYFVKVTIGNTTKTVRVIKN